MSLPLTNSQRDSGEGGIEAIITAGLSGPLWFQARYTALMSFTEADLLAYLDEALPPDRAAEIERVVRESGALRQRLSLLLERRDQGGHTLGEIWRRRQLSCIPRTELSRYLSGQLLQFERDYVEFHTGVIHCPVCEANLEDLRQLAQVPVEDQSLRRRKFFESSVGKLR